MNGGCSQPMYTVAICDDESHAIDTIERVVRDNLPDGSFQLLAYKTADAFLQAADSFDIALLDIQLEQSDGISLAQALLEKQPECQILFVSNYLEYALDVYQVPHISFIYKPQMEERLSVYLKQAVEKLQKNRRAQLLIKSGNSFSKINPWDILYLERRLRITTLHCSDQTIKTTEKLTSLMERLPNDQFCICHRCFVVNLAAVHLCSHTQLVLKDKSIVPIGRSHIMEIKQRFLTWCNWVDYIKRP